MSGDSLPYTEALVDKVRETFAAYRREHGQGIDPRRLLTGLLNNGVGLVETDRKAFLVDLGVHTGTLERLATATARIAELEAELSRTAGLAKDLAPEEGR